MSLPGGKFFIQDKLDTPAPHHESFEQLWLTKWQRPCQMGIYPFMFSAIQDFEPIVAKLVEQGQKEPYDWDEYAKVFFPKAEELYAAAEAAKAEGNNEKASELYLRSSAVYRISRFPAPRSEWQYRAWTEGKKAAKQGLALRERPTQELTIPHTHASANDKDSITFYYHLPPGAASGAPIPTIILLTGLDAYRTEIAVSIEGWSRHNVAVIVLEIPGTGDSPADPSDPKSSDRVFDSLLDWVDAQPELDPSRRVCWSFSTGGFYGIRLAHTHAERMTAVVAHGGGCHYMFSPDWLSRVNHLEYPFDLATTLAHKWGYGNDLERFSQEAQAKFSLLEDGTLDRSCTRLLLVNGTDDEIFPIDDIYLCLKHGGPKTVRLSEGRKHMGEPEASPTVLKWLYGIFGIEGNPMEQMKLTPSRPKFV